MQKVAFWLRPVPPFRLGLTAWTLRRRPINAIDSWDGEVYSRVLDIRGAAVLVQATQSGGLRSPRLQIKAEAVRLPSDAKDRIIEALQKLLGLRFDMRPFYRFAEAHPDLRALSRRFIGFKPPRFPSVFEAIANGIACQQLSLHVGLTLLNRLSAECGARFETTAGVRFAFPRPEPLWRLRALKLRRLGFSGNKTLALRSIAAEMVHRKFDPESLAGEADAQAFEDLIQRRGIGRWTAEYVLLRGLGRINVFPGDDVGARKNLRRWLNLRQELDYGAVQRVLSKWRPYSGLIYFHLLLDSLSADKD